MSKILGLSQIERGEPNMSEIRLSFDQDLFSNYLEPNQNDVFDTRRFSLQPENKPKLNTATSKGIRSTTPACSRSKMTSRTNSSRAIAKSTFGNSSLKTGTQLKLNKKVKNLEKKEELWKERANVWDRERKVYQKALENIDPCSFYKNQLESWKARSYLKKVSEDLTNDPLQELKNIFEWVCVQPDSIPFKSIKLSFVKMTSKIKEIESLLSQKKNEESLSKKNLELTEQILEIQAKLSSQNQEIQSFLTGIKELKHALSEKEQLIEDLQKNQEPDVYFKIQSDLENKSYELLMAATENKRLNKDLAQSNKSNEVYIKTIESLKTKLLNPVQRTLPLKDSATQTLRKIRNPKTRSTLSYQDFLQFTSCMASTVETLLDH